MENENSFGSHLTLDFKNCNPDKVNDLNLVFDISETFSWSKLNATYDKLNLTFQILARYEYYQKNCQDKKAKNLKSIFPKEVN